MSELVGQVAGAKRAAETARQRHPDFEIPNQRLTAHEEAVRQDVPGPDLDFAGANERTQPLFHLRPQFEVILEHDGLTVEMKKGNLAALDQRYHAVGHLHEPRAHLLVWLIPFAVPVRVNDEVEMVHWRSAQAGRRGSRMWRRSSITSSPR